MGNLSAKRELSDQQLRLGLTAACSRRRKEDAEVIRFIAIFDERRLYREAACSSMFRYCTKRLGMSEGEAYPRIRVARAAREFPQILDALEAGTVHVTGLHTIAPHLTRDNVDDLLARAAGRTKQELQLLAAELDPKPDVKASIRRVPRRSGKKSSACAPQAELPDSTIRSESDRAAGGRNTPAGETQPAGESGTELSIRGGRNATTGGAGAGRGEWTGQAERLLPARVSVCKPSKVQPLAPDRFRVQFTASERLKKDLERAQELVGHGATVEDLFEDAMSLLVAELEKEKLGVPGRKPGKVASPRARYIAKAIRREVYERDDGQCTFVDDHGRRCCERKGLHFDHIVPYARGGSSTADNLRLRCAAHNQLHAENCFGPLFMAGKRGGASRAEDRCEVYDRRPTQLGQREARPVARSTCVGVSPARGRTP